MLYISIKIGFCQTVARQRSWFLKRTRIPSFLLKIGERVVFPVNSVDWLFGDDVIVGDLAGRKRSLPAGLYDQVFASAGVEVDEDHVPDFRFDIPPEIGVIREPVGEAALEYDMVIAVVSERFDLGDFRKDMITTASRDPVCQNECLVAWKIDDGCFGCVVSPSVVKCNARNAISS
ncbi:MAG: hypothetical protein Q7S37_04700 [bacterium]|nr:hypothetical protein [bacterium]